MTAEQLSDLVQTVFGDAVKLVPRTEYNYSASLIDRETERVFWTATTNNELYSQLRSSPGEVSARREMIVNKPDLGLVEDEPAEIRKTKLQKLEQKINDAFNEATTIAAPDALTMKHYGNDNNRNGKPSRWRLEVNWVAIPLPRKRGRKRG